jgi:hypothetical protein
VFGTALQLSPSKYVIGVRLPIKKDIFEGFDAEKWEVITCTLEGDINMSTLAKYYQEQQKVGEEWVKCAEDLKKLSAD